MVIIVAGLPGSGKSYFAGRLSELLNATYFSNDQLRKNYLPEKNYSSNAKLMVYDKMLSETLNAVNDRKNVILDGTFYKESIREKFISTLSKKNQKIIFIEINAEPELIKERLKETRKDSDADYKIYQKIRAEYEPITQHHLTLLSRKDNINSMLKKASEYIAKNS